jgi:hybrid polyketide synthase / nonribosomal peptide synthetase ACE1
VEAEAIHLAFFPDKASGTEYPASKLYVGSIKSIIGHTEGTAGLAALLKGLLAIRNATIPPNLHLNRLNPKIERFYTDLEIATSPFPWPPVSGTRRASVNRLLSQLPSPLSYV